MTRSFVWPVSMTVRFHLFPFRTQKLSSLVPKIVGWKRPVKIGRCRLLKTQPPGRANGPARGCLYAPLAQLVEQLTLNQWVLGSSPRWCTKISPTEAWGLFFCITPRESRRSCTIGDENSSCRPSHVPAGKNAPAGRFLERGRVPNGAPKKSSAEWLGTFCCTIPFGAASAFAQALRFSSRGPVAKNAPQERFLNAPADGPPETALRKRRAVFCCVVPGYCELRAHHPLRGGFSVRAGALLQRAGKALESPNKAQLYSWALNFSILQSHRIP